MKTGSIHPALWCRTLGALTLYADRTETHRLMEAGKPLALLAYLCLAPEHKASRDHVAELFWSGCGLPQARHSLRQSLYRLRESSGGIELVRVRGTELELLPAVDVDCVEAENLASNGDRPRAYELLRGNFLEGFSIPESHEFESWAEAARLRFREVKADVARELVERSLAAGEPARALEIAEGLLGLHPFSPISIHVVMRALVALGRPAAAVARFHSYADLLHRELDDEPPDQIAAYARQLDEYLRARPEPSAAALPFVGRERQWAALEKAWEDAQAGHGATTLVEGSAGLGKTRLLTELQRRGRAAGGVVLTSKCYEIERSVPYAAVAQALAAACGRAELAAIAPAWLAEAARVLPELRERFPGIPDSAHDGGSPGSKRRLHEALLRCFGTLAAETPILLTVDDFQWADAPTLEVLHLLSHRLRETKMLVVASYRPAELTPAARQFARALCGDRAAASLLLGPLDAADVASLLHGLGDFVHDGIVGTLAAELHRHTSGNPLFLGELLSTLERERLLFVHDRCWHVAPEVSGAELPRTLGKLLADRVDGLAPWTRVCLETLAVAGQEISVELVARVLQISEPRAQLALNVLEEERLSKRAGTDVFELVHDELRRLAYHGIPDERRRMLHAAVGMALENQGDAERSGGVARLAYHFDQAGDRDRAHRYALAAAGEAEALAAPGEQRAHLDVAEAHAPKALPRVARVEHRGLTGFIRRHGLVAAGAALLALSSATVGYFYAPALGGGPAYRQGTIYLSAGRPSPTHRLRWPALRDHLASISPLQRGRPGDPPVMVRNVTDRNETHSKLFAVRGSDTVQLTFGQSDDADPHWAPDGRHLLFDRGWRAGATRYQENVVELDMADTVVRSLTSTPWQDVGASWSPAGTRITFLRDVAGVSNVWVADADGANALNVSEHFGLPRGVASSALAGDDHRLAVVYADTGSGRGAIYVVDLAEGTVTPLAATPPAVQLMRPLWSPDGRWLAYLTRRGESHALWVAPVDGSSAPVLIAEFAQEIMPREWVGGPRRWAERVVIEPKSIALRTGRGIRARATVLAPDRQPVNAVLRWSIVDTSVAAVDELGFVRGRRAGATLLVASVGGSRADTSVVTVTSAPAETLFVEDWRQGLETTRWIPFGYPRPVVVHGVSDLRPVFFNNGDYNHGSGAVSVHRFDIGEEGLTLEVQAWLQTTGQHWQNWQIALVDSPFSESGREGGVGPASLGFSGPEPTIPSPRWDCGGNMAREKPPLRLRRWIRVALSIRPDGWCECWVDGRNIGAQPLPDGFVKRPLAVMLRGMSVGTKLYHGRVVVTRGLKN